MAANPLDIETMPHHSSSQAKNKWAELVREVRQSGGVAITNHSKVEMVVIEADRYRAMAAQIDAKRQRDQAMLDELARRFDAQLEMLQQPDVHGKIEAMFEARGKLKNRPKAGQTY